MKLDDDRLAEQLADIWKQHPGSVPVRQVIIELDGVRLVDAVWTDDDSVTPTQAVRFQGASMIKTFVALLIIDEVAAGNRDWSDPVIVESADFSAGDGVLNAWQLPATISLANLQQVMIAVSDNTATNTLVDLLGGVAEVNARLGAHGFESRLRRHVGRREEPATDALPDQWLPSTDGLSVVTGEEHLQALRRCLADPVARRHFESQHDRRSLARPLSHEVTFAHKTGTSEGNRHDAGVLRHQGHDLAVSFFSDSTDMAESADHPACRAAAEAMAETLRLLGWEDLLVPDYRPG